MGLAAKYRRSLDERRVIRFTTIHPDGEHYAGVVLSIKKDYIVLREFFNFQMDSLEVLPKAVIKGYRDGPYEDSVNRVMNRLGLFRKLRLPAWLDKCETLADILRQLEKRDIWPAVEMYYWHKKKLETDFYIGPVSNVTEESFSLFCYDAKGAWEKNYSMDIAELYRISLENHYAETFNRYMRKYRMPVGSKKERGD